MTSIPEELLEQLERGNVIPLVGPEINHGVLPTEDELAQELAGRCGYPAREPLELPRVASYYLLTTHDRQGLVSFLRDRLDPANVVPSRRHRLIMQLEPRVVVTACYDSLLARAVREAGLGYTPVIRNEEVAYDDEQKMLLVWLRGVLDQPDSLIITEDDHRRFLLGRESLSDVLRGELARRTWLFIGFDIEDEWFPNYYDSVTHGLDHHRRRAYVVGETGSAYTRAWWAARAHILPMQVEPFLAQLVEQMEARRQPAPQQTTAVPGRPAAGQGEVGANEPLPERPYKLLDFYEMKDRTIFFGREGETQTLTALIHAHRLTILYGASGTGKTSLLLAGVAPRLTQGDAGYAFFHLRSLDDPGTVIRSAIRRRCPDLKLDDALSLVDFVAAAAEAMGATLVLVLDQFEEFFIRFNRERRQHFIAELGTLYDARDVPVKMVLSLREEWLAAVNEIRERIPEVFYIDLRLLPLARKQARRAITAPVERLGMRYQPALVERLLEDLAEGAPQSENALVMPPQLQLVCDALYEHAAGEGRRLITMADYETIGGAGGILVRYVEEALQEYPGQNREIARAVLTALVTSQGTKTGISRDELASEVGVEEERLTPVLSRLTGQRLVRCLEDGEHYELAHDILADTIGGWIGERELRLKRIREMLRREVEDWRHDPRVLLGRAKFRRVNEVRGDLQLTAAETEFLFRAAVHYDEEATYWLEQVANTETRLDILLEMLQGERTARITATNLLEQFPEERAGSALARTAVEDGESDVRDAAAASLAQRTSAAGISHLVEVVGRGIEPQRSHALRSLALIKDVDPAKVAGTELPRRHVNALLARIRLQRAGRALQVMTVAGAIGGAFALGIGPMPSVGRHFLLSSSYFAFASVTFILFVLGIIAGALMGLGIGIGGALAGQRAAVGRVAGGLLLGPVGFAIALYLLSTEGTLGENVLAAALFGGAVALGITLPVALSPERAVLIAAGGAFGGGLGLPLWGALAFPSFQEDVSLLLQVLSGTLTGAILGLAFLLAFQRMDDEASRRK